MKFLIANQSQYAEALNHKHEWTMDRSLLQHVNALLFTGGSDVSPSLYLSSHHPLTSSSLNRDLDEQELWRNAQRLRIPCVGICRGSQFLCVMNGGSLVQHTENHSIAGTHEIHTNTDKTLQVTSTHHQMMAPQGAFQVVAWAEGLSGFYQDGDQRKHITFVDSSKARDGEIREPEVVFWPRTRNLGVQYHPEYMTKDSPGWLYFNQLLDNYIENSMTAIKLDDRR